MQQHCQTQMLNFIMHLVFFSVKFCHITESRLQLERVEKREYDYGCHSVMSDKLTGGLWCFTNSDTQSDRFMAARKSKLIYFRLISSCFFSFNNDFTKLPSNCHRYNKHVCQELL